MRANDAVCGLLLILLAATMAVLTIPFPSYPGQRFGPDLLPLILSAGLTICGVLLILRGRKQLKAGAPWYALPGWLWQPPKVARYLLVVAALVLYIVAAEPLGFLPVSLIILMTLSIAFGARPLPAVITAVIATAAIYYFFSSIMRVPLPRGLIDLVM